MPAKSLLTKEEKHKKAAQLLCLVAAAAVFVVINWLISEQGSMLKSTPLSAIALWSFCFLLEYCIYEYISFIRAQYNNDRHLTLIFLIIYISVLVCIVAARYISINLMPAMLCALLLTFLLDRRVALVANVLTLQLSYICYLFIINDPNIMTDAAMLTIGTAGGIFISFVMQPDFTRLKVILTGVILSASLSLFTMIAMLFINPEIGVIIQSGLFTFTGGLGSLVLFFFLAPMTEWQFKLVTNSRLMEYCSFDQPLLKELADKSPGTFNHSLTVANIAERCAYAIGENCNLARAGAYYHDIGKLENPLYFAENQKGGYNPHDELVFETSIKMITRHTDAGYNILKEHHFPKEISDIARQHHGDSPLNYFYIKAQNITEGDLDTGDYRYAGPKPASKLAAIIMIADAVEAASRARLPDTTEGIVKLIDNIVKDKMSSGQFDDCDITMRDISTVKDIIAQVIEGIYHSRLSYPEKK